MGFFISTSRALNLQNAPMSRKTKFVVGILSTLLIVIVAVILFFRHLLTKSFPETKGVIETPGLSSTIRIYRDPLGVPHIFAETEEDLMFAVGYVHAQDRLWQMEMARRAGEGRLSELFGKATLNFDRMFRTIGFKRIVQQMEKNLHPDSHRLLTAYARGVNTLISHQKGKLPIEFDILGITPEPWTIEHSLMVARLQAWELNFSWWLDLTLGDLVNKLGQEKAREVFPSYPEEGPFILPFATGKIHAYAPTTLREVDQTYRRVFGIEAMGSGSNSWVVTGEKSLSGKPILANDPHLALPAPSRWYAIHLSGAGLEVAGVSIPGLPIVIIGRNQNIAWGLTNGMIDDADFYVEKIDSIHLDRYLYNGAWRELKVFEEEIIVRGSQPDTIQIRETHRGPIVSDVHSFPHFDLNVYKTDYEKNHALSLRWTGFEASDEIRAIYLVNRARNWEEFLQALRLFAVPTQNFIYADVRGNIGYQLAGRVPIRNRQSAIIPNPGWTRDNDWKGFIPFEKLPRMFNPPSQFIATANNKIVDNSYPYYLSDLWESPSRITRIQELLREKQRLSVEDFQRMQRDVISPHARELVPYILRAFDSRPILNDQVRVALVYLRNWNFSLDKDNVAAAIFNAFFIKLLQNIYRDEMGEELFNNYLILTNVPYRVTSRLLREGTSTWFDDVTTTEQETRDDIIRQSLSDALNYLREKLGDELKTWQWGKLHQLTFEHVLGRIHGMGKVFNIGPFQTGGASTTINSGHYSLTRPFKHLVGASMRKIADLSDPTSLLVVITSGQSGQPLHKHYRDQTPLWLNGEYHRLSMNRSDIEQSGWDLLILQSSQEE